jgi:hypothetical protein
MCIGPATVAEGPALVGRVQQSSILVIFHTSSSMPFPFACHYFVLVQRLVMFGLVCACVCMFKQVAMLHCYSLHACTDVKRLACHNIL